MFRVRPVTRCVETMPGHTDAVLHVSYSPDGKRLGESDDCGTVQYNVFLMSVALSLLIE